MPHIGVITSFSPNHLDWHASMDEYAAAKQILLQRQRPDDLAVLNTHDRRLASWDRLVRGRLLPLVADDELPRLPVPGWHNRMNAACAATAALAAGCSRDAIDRGLQSFRGLPQRMERIAEIEGRTFYNDSTSTTPESTIAALESVGKPALLLAGGHDKGFDFTEMVETIGRLAVGAAFFGEIGPKLHDRLAGLARRLRLDRRADARRRPGLVLAQLPSPATRSCSRPAVRATTSSAISASAGSGLRSW